MRPQTTRNSSGPPGPAPAYSPQQTFAGTAVVAALIVTGVLAVFYPTAALAVVATAVAAKLVARRLRRTRRKRRREGRARRICVPGTGACVEA